ncbi:hypothetical protein HJA87_06255 [Rhizobium bangladeshense]|uniref:dUTPase-like domain-containing protein n=1 Tax=Rhizobium bangladeshense TaxID=1138189 RepID=A0ABS7LDH0_9HYPH|nr:hypothetical protein [Rhizobium bangladeshense]MBY3589486.1 hypothetical protein [Rhizobium bangladeshense]
MTIISADGLDPKKFFKAGTPIAQGSSFDLTIGSIFDHAGNKVSGPFNLKPGHIVQVASAEIFNLPATVTGHVTYKTALTHQGIWALTVGIVDPGWDGPVATTLLNFSRADFPLSEGDPFLRVSLFEHAEVPQAKLRGAPPLPEYLRGVQKAALAQFPQTFLDSEAIAAKAGSNVMEQIRNQALGWLAGIAFIFGLAQFIADFASYKFSQPTPSEAPQVSKADVDRLQQELFLLKGELEKLRAEAKVELPREANVKPPSQAPIPSK